MPTPAQIAARGIKRVRVADREHEYFDPNAMIQAQAAAAAAALDPDYAGFIEIYTTKPDEVDP